MGHPINTPWGKPDHARTLTPGVTEVSTPSHGGILLDDERNAVVRELFPVFAPFAGGRWYEEDCDVAVVFLAFAAESWVDDPALRSAVLTVRGATALGYGPQWNGIARWLDSPDPRAQAIRARVAAWEATHAAEWEPGGGGSPPPGAPAGSWLSELRRVGDGARQTVLMASYPVRPLYTDAELEPVALPSPRPVARSASPASAIDPDYGGAFDGTRVTSDADPGL